MPVTFILKGNLPYMPARLYRGKAGNLTWAGMCISVEIYSPGGAAVHVSKGLFESGSV